MNMYWKLRLVALRIRMKLIVMKHYYLDSTRKKTKLKDTKRTFLKTKCVGQTVLYQFLRFKTQLSKVSTMLRFDSPDPKRNTYPNCSFFSSYQLTLNANGGAVEGELNMARISS